ncbi:type IV secretion system protein VirB9 [Burkholderia sp. WP9]|uniref:TrbG/VirB9 family P-type conjugative transfer protein n=1 Tax=Burkholderia sp. WP9 TaxID=1500263 RepID=UPI00089B917D|nr:TrbG/VirB9 family P-type conjugative transfer protein [Burkholderia sp. WP9]SEF12981.1 type IV secretion system protein VirB9 [Burkholderia sp. WP9]
MKGRTVRMSASSAAVALGFALAPIHARALETPHSCGSDPHIQCATYDPDQAYRVATMPGRVVMIQFEPGEHIINSGEGIGDARAWHVAINDSGAMLKPGAPQPETNLVLVTNRRTYSLSLVDVSVSQPATWMLRFDYPDTRAKAASAQQRRQATVSAALGSQQTSQQGNGPAVPASIANSAGVAKADPVTSVPAANIQYMMRGDRALAPTALWDDGRFTYFKYATARDLPTIFTKLPDGGEATANFHMEGDTVVVHEVSKSFVIRYGQAVLGIRNDGYSPDGHYNRSGSSVPGRARIERDHPDVSTN